MSTNSTMLSNMLSQLKSDKDSYLSAKVLDSELEDINHFVEKCKKYKDNKTLSQATDALDSLSSYIKNFIRESE